MPLTSLPADDLDHVLAHTRDLWANAREKRVFITGGTGFFGPWLVETFAHANETLRLGSELVVLTRDPAAVVARLPRFRGLPGVALLKGDVRSFEFPDGDFDIVIHGAAESSQQAHVGNHRHMFETIVDGTRRTLDLARNASASAYLLLSSGAVYGHQPVSLSMVPEEYPGGPDVSRPSSAYAEAKRAAEVLSAIEAESSGFSTRVARCFAFVGPHLPLDAHFAIGNFLRDALAGGPIRVSGDGTAVRSYLYTADLAIWLWTLALSPQAIGAYNVGSEDARSILETARGVASVVAPDALVDVAGSPGSTGALRRYVPSTARARRELGLRQTIAFEDAVRRTVEWHRAVVQTARA